MAMEALRVAAKESKFMKFILGGFIFLAVGGLIFTDVGGYFTGGAGATNIARVNDTKIDIRTFDSQLQGFLRQTGLSAEQAYETGIINAFLDARINDVLQLQAAEKLDLRLDNKTIAKQISKSFAGATKDQIETTLRAQGISEDALADSIRMQTMSQIIGAMPAVIKNYTPNFMIDATQKLQSQKRSGIIYTISKNDLAEDITVTDDEIESYYNENQSEFTLPEERQFILGKMTVDMAKKDLPAITDADIQNEYDENLDNFIIFETRKIEQAQVKDADIAQAIYEDTLNGTDLKQALENQTKSFDGYLAAQNYAAEGLPDALASASFDNKIKAGDVTPPVKTLLGYTIAKVTEITPEKTKPYDTVKADIKKELENQSVYNALYNKMIDSEDMIDGGEPFSTIAEKTGLTTSTTPFFKRDEIIDRTSGDFKTILESSSAITSEIYSLPENSATYPVELDDSTYYIIGAKSVRDASVLPLSDVKNDIKKSILVNKEQAQSESLLANWVNNLNNETTTITDIKSDSKITSKSFKDLGRDNVSDNKDLIFATSNNRYGYRITDKNDGVIVFVNDIKTNTDSKSADAEAMKSAQASYFDSLLLAYYRDSASISINDDLLDRTYSANYTE